MLVFPIKMFKFQTKQDMETKLQQTKMVKELDLIFSKWKQQCYKVLDGIFLAKTEKNNLASILKNKTKQKPNKRRRGRKYRTPIKSVLRR